MVKKTNYEKLINEVENNSKVVLTKSKPSLLGRLMYGLGFVVGLAFVTFIILLLFAGISWALRVIF